VSDSGGGAFGSDASGCTFLGNVATNTGGGAAYGTLNDCTIIGNRATNSTGSAVGGGAYQAALNNCTVSSNYSVGAGGGAGFGTLNNCTLAGNSAGAFGGGAYNGTLIACELTGNSARDGGGAAEATLIYCTLATNYAIYDGGGAFDCTVNASLLMGNSVDLVHGATFGGGAYLGVLIGCILSGNSARDGGGAHSATLNNCTLTNNTANEGGAACDAILTGCLLLGNSAGSGGGAAGGTLANCIIATNFANFGGGSSGATLLNCTAVGNFAVYGGGVYGGTVNNSIIYFNADENVHEANVLPWYSPTILNYSCTTPLPTNGVENIIAAPLFADFANGNLRLQTNSPCINAGRNAYVNSSTDLDGNPRISGSTVDIGAYEFQNPASIISYAWLHQFGLATDGSADFADPDGDAMNNWQEWRCGTDPTDPLSVLKMLTLSKSASGLVVSWQSVSGMKYCLQRSSNLAVHPAFSTLQTNITGQAGTTTYPDTDSPGDGPFFYRVSIQY
jgi:parallel beta-helix repeat protein